MNYLVTGGIGFIGSHMVELLLMEGHRVTVVDPNYAGVMFEHTEVDSPFWGEQRLRYFHADIDEHNIQNVLEHRNIDHVIHLGAWSNIPLCENNPEGAYNNNVEQTLRIVIACLHSPKVKSLAFAGSSAAEEPVGVYGWTKFMGENIINSMNPEQCKGVTLRFGNVYGARQNPKNGTLSAKYFDAYINGLTPKKFGNGEQRRDYIHVFDVVRAIYLAPQLPPGVHQVCTGTSMTTNKVIGHIESVARQAGFNPPKPEQTEWRKGDKDSVSMTPSNDLLKLGWTPMIDIVNGLKDQLEYAQERVSGVGWGVRDYIKLQLPPLRDGSEDAPEVSSADSQA